MTDSTGMGINPIWAVAIVLLFFLFERRGGLGDMWGGGHPAVIGGSNFNNDCVNNKNILEFGFAAANANTNQINALSQQATANWYNTNQHIGNIYQKQQEEKIFDLKMQNIQLQNQIYNQGQFNMLNSRLDAISCNMLVKPPVYGCASFIANGCQYPQQTTTTTTPAT